MYWPAFPSALVTVLFTAWVFLVRPAWKRHRATRPEPPESVPEKREPRDKTRPWLDDLETVAEGDARLITCPVCGMEDPRGLKGTFMGEWPAHETCLEWLGPWGVRPPHLVLPTTRATITIDELAERMERLIASSFSVPAPDVRDRFKRSSCDCGMEFAGSEADVQRSMGVHRDSGQHERAMRSMQPRTRYCTCGRRFDGTPAGIHEAMAAHEHSGVCPHHPNA